MTYGTTIEIDERVPQLHMVRDFDAPPAAVFRAWADPAIVVRWLGPADVTMETERWNCSTGGAYRYVHRRGDDEFWFHGSFHEVRPGELIVQTFTWEGMPDSVALETVRFEDLGDGRTRVRTSSLVDSFEGRDAFVASGMESGVLASYAKLDELLAAG
jgi:uncharacterized protein YndB with AHSA1/START domain